VNPDATAGFLTNDSTAGKSDSVAQIEASLALLDTLLKELHAQEASSTLQGDLLPSESSFDGNSDQEIPGDIQIPHVSNPLNPSAHDAGDNNPVSGNTHFDHSHELIVIDTSLPDFESLLAAWQLDASADRDFTLLLLAPSDHGIDVISNFLLQSGQQYDAVHLVTHGFSGGLRLGDTTLTAGTLADHATQLDAWRSSLTPDADLFLYGCSIADSISGAAFVDEFANLLDIDVAASTNATGARSLGGDWDLEYRHGETLASLSVSPTEDLNWEHLLLTYTVRDDFATAAYTNNNGTNSWSAAWSETDAAGAGATTGNILITGGQLQMQAANSADLISRQANLSGAHAATLTFTYDSTLDNNASTTSITLDVSSDGVNWVTLDTFSRTLNTAAGSKSYSITSYISSQTRVRLDVGTAAAGAFYLFVDNFQISYDINTSPTAVADTATAVEAGGVSNGTAGTNPTGNVLTNDTDADSGDTKTVSGVAAGVVGSASTNVGSNVTGTYGTINIAANGAYTYTVDNNNATVQALRTSGNTLTDTFTYTMRDTLGLASTTQITVTIQGANDAPNDITGTLTIAENSANGSAVGTVTRSDVDSGDTRTWSLTDNAGGRFAINSSTGAVTVANSSLLNFESATSHNITIRVTDTAGATFDKVLAVTVSDVAEVLTLTVGNDTFTDNGFTETSVDASGGDDLVYVSSGNDNLNGGTGTDTVSYENATSAVTVSLALTTAQNTVGSGTDTLQQFENLTGSSFNDTLTGDANGNTLRGAAGNDTLTGDAGADTFNVDSGTDTITDLSNGSDTIVIAAGATANATAVGAWTATASTSNAGTASITAGGFSINVGSATGASGWTITNSGNATAVTLTGSANADVITGGTNADTLVGGAGNDSLTGGTGNDTIDGGVGNDILDGGEGSDTYLYSLSGYQGYDWIQDTGLTGTDTIRVTGAGVNMWLGGNLLGIEAVDLSNRTDVTFSISNGTADFRSVTFLNTRFSVMEAWSGGAIYGSSGSDSLTLSGGVAGILLDGSEGSDDYLVPTNAWGSYNDSGTSGTDRFLVTQNGGKLGVSGSISGIEQINFQNYTGTTVDVGWGGTVDFTNISMLNGNFSQMQIIDTTAATIIGSSLNDVIVGNAGNDTLRGGLGDDTINGGAGNDTLTGGAGNDTFTVASGTDTITDLGNGIDIVNISAGATANATAAAAWTATAATSNAGTATITASGFNINVSLATGASGWTITNSGNATAVTLVGSANADTLTGGNSNDTLAGGAGSDNLSGGSGDDSITGGTGNDVIDGGIGNDTVVYSGAYSDYSLTWIAGGFTIVDLRGGSPDGTDTVTNVEAITFSHGTYTLNLGANNSETLTGTASSEFLVGFNLDDKIHASDGDDILDGGDGNDTLNGQNGVDILVGGLDDDILTGGASNDTLIGGAGNDTFNVDFGTDTITDLSNGTDIVVISAGATANATAAAAWTATASTSNAGTATITASGFKINVSSATGASGWTLTNSGNATAVTLAGSANADTLTGGHGNDTLTGGSGADTFNVAAGTDSITDLGNGADIVVISAGATANATAAAAWTATSSTSNAGTGSINASGFSINLSAATGASSWTVTNSGNAMAVTLTGSANADVLTGGTNKDTLIGGSGNDTLIGGAGNDTFTVDSGTDTITDLGNDADIVNISAGATANATAADAWTATAATSNAGTASITASGFSINVSAATGPSGWTITNSGNATAVALTGSANADSLTGGDGNDTLTGGGGNDTLIGGAGTDLANFSGNWRDYTITTGSDGQGTFYQLIDGTSNRDGTDKIYNIENIQFADGTVSAASLQNVAPSATSDAGTAVEAGGVSNATAGSNATGNVLTNDTDTNTLDTKTVTGVAVGTVGSASTNVGSNVTGTYGTINIAANGTFTYTVDNSNPTVQALRNSGNTLTDVFTYTVRDAAGLTSTTQLTVTIQGANDAPHDITGSLSVDENAANGTGMGVQYENRLLYSERFEVGNWSRIGAAITADAGIAPDGTLTADGYTGGQGSSIRQTTTDSFAVGTQITFSLYVKADGRSTIQIRGDNKGAFNNGDVARTYNLNNLTSTASYGTTTGSITDVGNGWRLLTLSAVATNSGAFVAVIDGLDNGGETGGYLIWGAQVNVGADNPYSATTTTSRSADSSFTVADADSGEAFIYSLVNNAGGRFAVNSSTGVVTVANGSLLDYEAATSHSITVRVTDAAGATFDKVMLVQLNDVNEFSEGAISDTNPAANSLPENSANGTAVGITAFAVDSDATNNTMTYSLDDNAGGRFAINSSTGVVTVANGSLLNFETATSHVITIRATSSDGSFSTANFTINLTDVNEFDVGAVTDANATANSIAENSANGAAVGITASAADADGSNNTITYSLDDTAGGRFTINSSTGVVTVLDGTLLNFEAAISHAITVRATSSDGSFSTANFTINLTNVNEAPTAVADTAIAVEAGGVSNGTGGVSPTGNVLTNDTDVDAGDTKTVTGVASGVVGSASTNVGSSVTGTYGSINIAANGSFTYTVDNSNAAVQALRTTANTLQDVFSYTMQDAGGLTSTTQITVTIQGANDAPDVVNDAATAIEAGGTANGTAGTNPTGNVLTNDTDVDAGDTKTVSGVAAGVVSSASTNVGSAVTGTYGSINISSTGAYTYTVDNANVSVQALRTSINTLTDVFTYTMTDTSGATRTNQITVTIQGANDAPNDITGTLSIAEISSNGTSVGTVAGQDVDAGDTRTYSLVDSAGGRFAIHSSTGTVTVANSSLLNYEAATSHQITVRVTDTAGAMFDKVMTVAITDINEFDVGPITDINANGNSIAENAAAGTVVGITASATDLDGTNNSITYAFDDNAGGRFAIDSSTGVVTVADGSLLDYEAAVSHNIIVRAMSVDGSFNTQSFTIHLTDIDEFVVSTPIVDMNPAADLLAENSPNGTLAGITANAVDLDGTGNTITYSLDDSAGGRFAIHSSTGVVTLADSSLLNYEVAISHNIIIRATSVDLSYSTQSFTIHLTDVDEFDVGSASDTDATPNRVAENSAVGTIVGVTASASDADGTTNTVTYSLADSAGGRFAIDSITGVVTVANSILLDYETTMSHTMVVLATSADGSVSNTSFTISVLPVNERPVTQGERYQTDFSTPLKITYSDLLANDSDPEGDRMQITFITLPLPGVFLQGETGAFYFKPESNFVGTVTLVYAVSDGSLTSDPQIAEIVITPPATTVISAPTDRSAPVAVQANSMNTVNETISSARADVVGAIDGANASIKEDAPNEVATAISVSVLDPRTLRSEWNGDNSSPSKSEGYLQEISLWSDARIVQGQAIQRLQLDIGEMLTSETSQISFPQFIRSEEREALEREKQQFFFQSATPIAFGTAIGAGISLHILASAQLGSSLLSQSGLFVPLDPLMVLEGSSKVKKSKEREDILFEVASLKSNGEK